MKRSSRLLYQIQDFMTPAPQSVQRDRPVAEALEIMRRARVRHLPVLDGARLVGVVAERDCYFIETLRGADARTVRVDAAMTEDLYEVSPEAPLDEVAETMASRKYGSAVIARGSTVVGIFTTVDALHALAEILRKH
jgi:acetoin utilization protein AcuB